jgi:hypothetical protein
MQVRGDRIYGGSKCLAWHASSRGTGYCQPCCLGNGGGVLVAMVRAVVAMLVMSAAAGHNGRRAGGGRGASHGGHVIQGLII